MAPLSTEAARTPLLHSTTSDSSSSDAEDHTPPTSYIFDFKKIQFHSQFLHKSPTGYPPYRPLAVLSGHIGSVSSLALCGEFILSASQGKDIIVWQQPDLRVFTKFGHGDGSVKAVVAVGSRVFTAHQDGKIRVWKVSRRSENNFRLVNTLPTTKDCLGKFMKQSNYVQTRRHHKILWIKHADSISCLTVHNGLIYSGSWDKTLKIWRVSDLKCLESIKAHDDAINGVVVASNGIVYSASADGKIKAWGRKLSKKPQEEISHSLMGILEGHKDVSINSIVVSNDGKWVYGGISDGYVMGWEKSGESPLSWNWKVVCERKGHKMAVLCVCLMGEILCSGSADKSIGIWRREAFGKLCRIGVINGHEGPIKCLQAAPNGVGDGFLLYSGSLDKSLRVWWVSSSKASSSSSSSSAAAAIVAEEEKKSMIISF